jgi:hypothetical protein
MSDVWQGLAGIGAQDPQWAMLDEQQKAHAALQNPAFTQTVATGAQAQTLKDNAQALSQAHVTANWDAANQSAAQLSGVSQQMQGIGFGGGQLGAAAINAAQAKVANAGGGLGGLKTVGQTGAAAGNAAAGIAQNESSQMLSAASQANANVSAAKLQQLVVNAALDHANRVNTLGSQNVAAGVGELANQTTSQLSNYRNQASTAVTGLDNSATHAQNQAALQWAQSLLSGVSAGAGIGTDIYNSVNNTDGTSAAGAVSDLSPGALSLSPEFSVGLGSGTTSALTEPSLGDSLATPQTLSGVNTQLSLDQSLFSTPSNLFGVY